ncbi:DUF1036 domain-containing protein [Phaeobacter sp. C3_T13_0]|uniref:DUF1036 domain-containing protein n=1 Tax=Phaeobacter cretensis TaxID=3342641 RepID=UPI0039BC3E5C
MYARLILALLLAPLLVVQPAQADQAYVGLEICNDTPVPQSVSVAYREDGQWTSHGWWHLPPETCESIIDSPLQNRFYYFHSQAQGWQFLDERISFCTAPGEFSISGDKNCVTRGYENAFFAKIDTTVASELEGVAPLAYVAALGDHSRSQNSGTDTGAVASGSIFEVGAPFVRDVTFQGCQRRRGDGRVICKMVANDGQLCVMDDGRTEQAIIDRLQQLEPGTPVRVSGNSLATDDRITHVSLSTLTERDETRYDHMLQQLSGEWVSQADGYDHFVVEGATRRNYYGVVETMTELLSVQNACGDSPEDGPYLVSQAEDGGPDHCYKITSLTENDLVLTYLPHGTELRYQRSDLPLN